MQEAEELHPLFAAMTIALVADQKTESEHDQQVHQEKNEYLCHVLPPGQTCVIEY